jgi:phenylpropionate dioxygenase-like ring-hydroxylating dioxygenase large terminal subunit
MFVHEDAQEGVDYDLDSLTELWHVTYEQDKELCELTQIGVQSKRFVPGPLSEREAGVRSVLMAYLDLMGE